MSTRADPLALLSPVEVPRAEVLAAGHDREEAFSDLFPISPIAGFDATNPLGDYRGGKPPDSSPLLPVLRRLEIYRLDIYAAEEANDWVRTEETRRGLIARGLQNHLIQCIDKGYRNLLAADSSESAALTVLGTYTVEKSSEAGEFYTQRLDGTAEQLAALDRHEDWPKPTEIDGMPVIDLSTVFSTITGQMRPSPEVQREQERDYLQDQMAMLRSRQERLKFERLSAGAILQFLKQAVEPVPTESTGSANGRG